MKSKRRRNIIISSVVLFILVILAFRACNRETPPQVTTAVAEIRNITEIVTASGKIQPETEVRISADVSGEIVELHVAEGDRVVKGQLLLKINPEVYVSARDRMVASLNGARASLSNARARAAQAEAQLRNATSTFNRNEQLYNEGLIAEAEFENIRSQYEVAKGEAEAARQSVLGAEYSVNSAMASVREAEEQLRKTTIFAPVTGTVSMLNVEKGERVVGTLQMAGTELMRVANLEEMEVSVEVNENDIVRVSRHDTADVTIDAYPDRVFRGMVTEIASSSRADALSPDQVTNFEVKVQIMRPSYEDLIDPERPHLSPFRPGMSATVDIRTNTVKQVVSVPIPAVTVRSERNEQDAEELREYVFLYDNGLALQRAVKSGIQDNEYIEVISGLKEGDEVITGPYELVSQELKDSTAVMIAPPEGDGQADFSRP